MNKDMLVFIAKDKILELEKTSLANISKTEDTQMVAKIMKLYEEIRDENK